MNFMIFEYIFAFLIAFLVAFVSTPIVKKISFKVGAVDIPKDKRRMHKKPIARLGGMAIVAGFLSSLFFVIVTLWIDTENPPIFNHVRLLGLVIGMFIILVIGVIDDIKQLGPKIKLIFQILAAIVIVITGSKIAVITNPFSEISHSILSDYISIPLTIIWIVIVTNSINLIDGLDGLAAGVSSIAALSLFFVSVINQQYDIAILTAVLAGSTLGFLPHNFSPATIFMGDTGATFLGFTLSVISIQGTLKSYTAIAITVPLLILGLPIFDTLFTIFRRFLRGKPIMTADRGHLHHRLVDLGLSHKQSVTVIYIISSSFGICAIVLSNRGVFSSLILILSMSIFIIGGAKYMTQITDKGTKEDMDDKEDKDNKDVSEDVANKEKK